MTNEDIIKMVREVCDKDKVDPVHNDMVTLTIEELGRLLAAERNRTWTQDHWTEYERSIAAAEREACAKVAEDTGNISGNMNKTWRNGCFDAAFAIRERGAP